MKFDDGVFKSKVYSELLSLNLKGKRILDAGCGEGHYIKILLKLKPRRLLCIDRNYKIKENIKNKKVNFLICNMEDLKFKDEYFDMVFCSRVLLYVDIKKTLKELERVTKKQGYIILILMEKGYFLMRLLEGNLKRIFNFINLIYSTLFNTKLFKNLDNIDSEFNVNRNMHHSKKLKKIVLDRFLIFPKYSMLIYKKVLEDVSGKKKEKILLLQ